MQQPSAVFGSSTDIDLSEVAISEIHGTRYYLNSEGFKTVAPIHLASLTMFAEAQASDGMPVRETYSSVESTVQDLPAVSELTTRARELASRVTATRNAPVGEEFTGPVLLEGVGSAAVHRRDAGAADARAAPARLRESARCPAQPTPFLSRTGLRVMADSFSASDTPSLKQFNGKPVAGAYVVDDEGVRAKRRHAGRQGPAGDAADAAARRRKISCSRTGTAARAAAHGQACSSSRARRRFRLPT